MKDENKRIKHLLCVNRSALRFFFSIFLSLSRFFFRSLSNHNEEENSSSISVMIVCSVLCTECIRNKNLPCFEAQKNCLFQFSLYPYVVVVDLFFVLLSRVVDTSIVSVVKVQIFICICAKTMHHNNTQQKKVK